MASRPKPTPGFTERVRASFARQRIMAFLHARLVDVKPGQVRIEVPMRPEFVQQHGFLHAGVLGTIADSAGGYAAYTLMSAVDSVLTVEYKLHLLRPAVGDRFVATGSVRRGGRSITTCELSVDAIRGRRRSECAWGTQTLMRVPAEGLGQPPG